MKKIILVPHTHWDREWYFTSATSSLLLNRLKFDIKNHQTPFSFNLDGQVSLLEEISEENDYHNFLKKYKVTAGPLYVQQDTFNVLLSTTLNNIEFGLKTLGQYSPKTVYMPDTFGFNEQLPQIFKHYGFDNFLFWRGIKPDDKVKSNIFKWIGYDGTKIFATNLPEGYFCLGQYFAYNQERDYEVFKKQLIDYVKKLEKYRDQNVYLAPLGGDQAPYEKDITNALKFINESQRDYKVVIGTYDDYFNIVNKNNLPNIDYSLNYSGTSKIHRTIHSNRYDIKKSFRELENKTYYQMEPLEIIYKKMGGVLLSDKFKEKSIYKEILKSSAHDSLGGCNSDQTNDFILLRNQKTLSFVQSYIDLMLRDIKENTILKKDEYIVFNLSPFVRNISYHDIISNKSEKKIFSSTGEIIEYEQEDLSLSKNEKLVNHHISISVENMEPFSMKKIKINNKATNKHKLKNINPEFVIKVEDDLGDSFDFSYSNKKPKFYKNFTHAYTTTGTSKHFISKYIVKEINMSIIC